MSAINYSDLHKIYNKHKYNLPPAVESKPVEPVIPQIEEPEPKPEPEPKVIYVQTKSDVIGDLTHNIVGSVYRNDLAGVIARNFVGWKIWDFLTTPQEYPSNQGWH